MFLNSYRLPLRTFQATQTYSVVAQIKFLYKIPETDWAWIKTFWNLECEFWSALEKLGPEAEDVQKGTDININKITSTKASNLPSTV